MKLTLHEFCNLGYLPRTSCSVISLSRLFEVKIRHASSIGYYCWLPVGLSVNFSVLLRSFQFGSSIFELRHLRLKLRWIHEPSFIIQIVRQLFTYYKVKTCTISMVNYPCVSKSAFQWEVVKHFTIFQTVLKRWNYLLHNKILRKGNLVSKTVIWPWSFSRPTSTILFQDIYDTIRNCGSFA